MDQLGRDLSRVLKRNIVELFEGALKAVIEDEERQASAGAPNVAQETCVFLIHIDGYELMLHYDRNRPGQLVLLRGGRISDRLN